TRTATTRFSSLPLHDALPISEEIDARGLAVSPGFVDIHSHADGSLDDDPRAESAVRQGITTIVAGQDGGSRANGADDRSFTELRSEEHTSELQSRENLVCRLL